MNKRPGWRMAALALALPLVAATIEKASAQPAAPPPAQPAAPLDYDPGYCSRDIQSEAGNNTGQRACAQTPDRQRTIDAYVHRDPESGLNKIIIYSNGLHNEPHAVSRPGQVAGMQVSDGLGRLCWLEKSNNRGALYCADFATLYQARDDQNQPAKPIAPVMAAEDFAIIRSNNDINLRRYVGDILVLGAGPTHPIYIVDPTIQPDGSRHAWQYGSGAKDFYTYVCQANSIAGSETGFPSKILQDGSQFPIPLRVQRQAGAVDIGRPGGPRVASNTQ